MRNKLTIILLGAVAMAAGAKEPKKPAQRQPEISTSMRRDIMAAQRDFARAKARHDSALEKARALIGEAALACQAAGKTLDQRRLECVEPLAGPGVAAAGKPAGK